MATQDAVFHRRRCDACGAVLLPDLGEQFFCEHCGSPLRDGNGSFEISAQAPKGLDGDVSGVEAAKEPERPDEMGARIGSKPRGAPKRIELRPTGAAATQRSQRPERRGQVSSGVLLAVLLALGFLCLLGGIAAVLLGFS